MFNVPLGARPWFQGVFVFILAAVGVLFFTNVSLAGAPTGTLTGTAQTITVFATSTLNTVTFTDVTPSEVTAANDLRIRIASGINAVFDTSVTAPTFGGTASTSTAASVTYASGNTVMVVDATERFSPGGTLTIAGLKVIGVNYQTSAAALEFSIDGGATYGTAAASTNITVNPSALSSTAVTPAALTAGTIGTATVTFTTATSTPANGKIQVVFPSGFNVSSVGSSDGTCSSMDGSFSTGVSSQTVTITRSGGTLKLPAAQTCTIANVRNPAAGAAGVYTIYTEASGGATQKIGQDEAVTASTFTNGSLTSASVSPDNTTLSHTGSVNVAFTTAGAIPADGKIVVIFPAGYNISATNSVSCASMDGSFALSRSGQTVTITRSGGTLQTAAAENCTINNTINPGVSGLSGTYTIKTTDSADANIDTNTSVAGTTFGGGSYGDITPPGPVTNTKVALGSDGKSVTLTWTNPTDTDLSGVRVYRSEVSGVLGAMLTKTSAGTYADTGLVTGTAYYYILRPLDTSGNERVDTVEYSATPTVSVGGTTPSTSVTTPASPSATGSVPTTATPTLPTGVSVGDVVRGSLSAVYFVAVDGKRYVFPNETVYKTWYLDFKAVKVVTDDTLAKLPLGGTVKVRPGVILLKIVSDPKVYAVEPGGALRWIETEALATQLFGSAWAKRVRDIDVALFTGYTVGNSVNSQVYPVGSIVRDQNNNIYAVVSQGGTQLRRHFSGDALNQNRFSADAAVSATTSALPAIGAEITGAEDGFTKYVP